MINYFLSFTVQGCSQPPCIFVSNTTDILSVNIDLSSSKPVFQRLTRAVAIDVHVNRRLIFWSDVIEKNIKRANIDGSNISIIIDNTVGICDGLAVEWTTDLLYWSDTNVNTIEVARLDGSKRTVLVTSQLDKPRGIALDPSSG